MIARAEQELRSDVNRSFLIRAHVNRSIPIEAQFLLAIVRPGLETASLGCVTVHSTDSLSRVPPLAPRRKSRSDQKDLRTPRTHHRHTYFPSASCSRRPDMTN